MRLISHEGSYFDKSDKEQVNPKYFGLNSKMQQGYKYTIEDEDVKAAKVWLDVWDKMQEVMQLESCTTFKEFNEIINSCEYVSDWANDFEDCMCNIIVGSKDAELVDVYGNIRIKLNEQFLNFYEKDEVLSIENSKLAIAETYFLIGNKEKGEELFEEYLKINPKCGRAWLCWSDQYWLYKRDADFKRGEELLLAALDVPGLKDRDDIEFRLQTLYEEMGDEEKLKALETQIDIEKENTRFENLNQSVSDKVGRNNPCPCGSSKKYKKCCGSGIGE